MKKRIVSGLLSVCVLFAFVPCLSVSAESYQGNLPDSWFTSSYELPVDFNDMLLALKSNESLSIYDEFYVFGSYDESNGYYIHLINPSNQYTYTDGSGSVAYMGDIYESSIYTSVSQIENTEYTLVDKSVPPQSYEGYNSLVYNLNGNYSYNSTFYYRGQLTNGGSQSLDFLVKISTEYTPQFEEAPLPFFSMEVEDFYDWIINNNKLVELPLYITQSKLKSFLQFYKSFGSSNSFFVSKIADWFEHMNIASQSLSNISALKTATDKLYSEYINYRSGTHAYWPSSSHIQERDSIDTKTDNNDLTLVTDNSNDTPDISILRDILRGVIAVSNNVNQGTSNIIQKLEQLDFTVNLVNDGGLAKTDLRELYVYEPTAFNDDLQQFITDIEDVQSVPMGYINDINQNSLMPENMLQDKNSLTVNLPTITGFTVGNNGSTYSTQTGTHVLKSTDYPWLDPIVQKIKRFGSIILIIGYLVHLRYRIPELVRGE